MSNSVKEREELAFDDWLRGFTRYLVDCGMPARQAMRYEHEYLQDARRHYDNSLSPSEAAALELMP